MSCGETKKTVLVMSGIFVLLWNGPVVAGFPPDIFDSHYESLHDGDINLGAIVSVHTNDRGRCTETTTMGLSAIEFLEAVLFAVRQVNTDQMIPGVTLGVYVLDDCFSASLSLMRAIQFMPVTAQNYTRFADHVHSSHSLSLGVVPAPISSYSPRKEGNLTVVSRRFPEADVVSLPKYFEDKKNLSFSATKHSTDGTGVEKSTNNTNDESHNRSSHGFSKTDVMHGAAAKTDLSSDVTSSLKDNPVSESTPSSGTNVTDDDKTGSKPDTFQQGLPMFFDVAGVIGAFTSQHTIEVAKVLQLFQLPLISPSATSDVLSDKQSFPFFLRTLPPDRDQVNAMGQLVRHFNWTYVSLVYSQDPYGHGSHGRLTDTLTALDVCVAQTLTLSATMTPAQYDVVIRSLSRHQGARVVLLYADVKHVRPLLEAAVRNAASQELLWVGSDSLFTFLQHSTHLCDVNLGSMAVKAHAVTPPAFVRHLMGKVHHPCHGQACDSLEKWELPADVRRLTDIIDQWSPSQQLPMFGVAAFVIDAVYVYAHALRALLRENCPTARGIQARDCVRRHSVHPYLQRVQFKGTGGRFEFDENGDVVGAIEVRQCQRRVGEAASYQLIGTWEHRHDHLHVQQAQFPQRQDKESEGGVPISACAQPCGNGQIYAFTRQTCCWSCVDCKVNEITTANASGCVPCPPLQWPDPEGRRQCQDIVVPPTPTQPAVTLALQVAAVVGLMLTFVTSFTFCLYRGQRVIRSSSRELSGVMLGGLTTSYLLVFPLLAMPTQFSCYVTHLGFGLTFTLVYAPLLVKTHRIFRIFRAGRQSAALPRCTSSASQLGITTALISVQVVIVTISTTLDPPAAQLYQPVLTQPTVERLCHFPITGLAPSLAYHVLLVLLCTVLAFKTRSLPDNYNESRYIAFCVDTTLLVWIIFVPAYFTAAVGAHKVVVLVLIHLINNYVQLSCLFLPRLYALYRHIKQPPGAHSDAAANKLGSSYGLIPVKGVEFGNNSRRYGVDSGERAGGNSGCVASRDGCTGGHDGQYSISEVMGSNTSSNGGSSVVVWECRDDLPSTECAAV